MTPDNDSLLVAFGMPAFLAPWTDRFFEPPELELIDALAAGPLPEAEVFRRVPGLTAGDLARAVRRGVVDVDDEAGSTGEEAASAGRVSLAGFHARFEIWAMFEGWKDVPDDVAARLNEWELSYSQTGIAADLGIGPDGGISADPGSSRNAAYAYLLLAEAEGMVRSAAHVYQWPCDCRSMFRRCRKPVNVCLRFHNDRGLGWEISAERAVELLREADRAGLMRTGFTDTEEASGEVCNCCTDCCFPHLAADRLGITGEWPRRRYIAAVDAAACTLCGRCAKRCPFAALTLDPDPGSASVSEPAPGTVVAVTGAPASACEPGDGGRSAKGTRSLLFAADLCRGCGLCSTGCPEDAIAMHDRPASF